MPQHDECEPTTNEALHAALFGITVLIPSLKIVPDVNGGLSINMDGYPESCLKIWEDGKAEFFRFQDGALTDRRECQIPYPKWFLSRPLA